MSLVLLVFFRKRRRLYRGIALKNLERHHNLCMILPCIGQWHSLQRAQMLIPSLFKILRPLKILGPLKNLSLNKIFVPLMILFLLNILVYLKILSCSRSSSTSIVVACKRTLFFLRSIAPSHKGFESIT